MRSVLLFPAGIIVGAALAWAFLEGLDKVAIVRPDAPASDAADYRAPIAPSLPDEFPYDSEPPDARDRELEGKRAQKYYTALAVVDAIRERVDAFLEDAANAIAAGTEPGRIQGLIELLPEHDRASTYEKLLARHPDLAWDVGRLADLYREEGDPGRAFEILAEQIEDAEDGLAPLITRLISLEPARAATLLLGLVEDRSFGTSLLVHIANSLVEADENDFARPFLMRALGKTPSSSEGLALLARLDPGEAARMAEIAAEKSPKDPAVWARLAGFRADAGDASGAFAAYKLAAVLETDEDTRRNWFLGMLRTDPRAALASLKHMVNEDDDEALGLLGRAYIRNERASDAFDVYWKAHAKDPSDSEWLRRLVAIDSARSVESFEKEIGGPSGPQNDEVVGALGHALFAQGDAARAYEMYMRASRMEADDGEWLRGMSKADPLRAVEHLESRLTAEPEEEIVLGALGDAYAKLGRQADATRAYEKALEHGDNAGRWMAALAVADSARGLTMIRGAIDASPGDDELWGALGDAYAGLGRTEEARAAYEKALELDPADWEWNLRRDHLR